MQIDRSIDEIKLREISDLSILRTEIERPGKLGFLLLFFSPLYLAFRLDLVWCFGMLVYFPTRSDILRFIEWGNGSGAELLQRVTTLRRDGDAVFPLIFLDRSSGVKPHRWGHHSLPWVLLLSVNHSRTHASDGNGRVSHFSPQFLRNNTHYLYQPQDRVKTIQLN